MGATAHGWPMVKLGDLLTPAGRSEKITDTANETFVTLKLHGQGATRRTIGTGKTPRPFTGYRVSSGQFMYSRIDARNGAFAIIPVELDGAVVSKDFPVFEISDHLDPPYLSHYSRSGILEQLARSRSDGATNRQRVKEDVFLDFKIPLPPLEEQRRIAKILDRSSALLNLSNRKIEKLALFSYGLLQEYHSTFASELSVVKLGDVIQRIESGRSPTCSQEAASSSDEFGVLKLSAVTTGSFIESENKLFEGAPETMMPKKVRRGDILMTRKNTPELVGAVALVDKEPNPTLFFPDLVFRLVPRLDKIREDYLALLMMCEPYRTRVRSLASGSARSMSNISQKKLKSLVIDILPTRRQDDVMRLAYDSSLVASIHSKRHQKLQELHQSLSTRAFRGEI